MTEPNENTTDMRELIMVGMPHSGKTTFLALFYLAVRESKRTQLKLASWIGDREHLNRIAAGLLSCTGAEHTPTGDQHKFDLPLITPDGEAVRIVIPDLSGEVWQDALQNRRWSSEMDERVRAADTVLVFLHPKMIEAGPSINRVHELTAILDPCAAEHDDPVVLADSARKHGGFPGGPPTQVVLVDLIQLTCEQRGRASARVCLIVSAWDEAEGTPAEFVASNLPLLHQYLTSNASWLDWRIFGVSGQGGRFDDSQAREALAKQDPVDRAIVMAGDGSKADVGEIVEWALEVE